MPVASNEPTQILIAWLSADPVESARIRRSVEGRDYGDIAGDVADYMLVHANEPPAAALVAWGTANGLAEGSRDNILRLVCDHVDWTDLVTRLPAPPEARR